MRRIFLHTCPGWESARRERGFSLIELMIAIALGLLILAGLTTVFVSTSATRSEIERNSRQLENGRYAMELLREDIQFAGMYAELDMPNVAALPAALPDPCSTTLVERTFSAGGSPGALRLHVQGVNNYSSGLACLGAGAVKAGTDVVIVRRVKTCIAGSAGCDAIVAGKPYLQIPFCANPVAVSASTTSTHALAPSPNTTEFVHLLKDCVTPAPLRPYVVYLYFVGPDNILKRAEFTGTAMGNITSLVDGIENLQLDYGVDSAGNDGTVDAYTASPADVAAWSNVVAVQINLLARNTEASPGYTDTKTYNLGISAGSVGPFNDGFRRHAYRALARIQNVSGRREKP